MKQYIGTKIISAKPMTLKEWKTLCEARRMPKKETESLEDKEGYLVEYLNSPNRNLIGFDNYVSWSPKAPFEDAYSLLENLSFGSVLFAMKNGMKATRPEWGEHVNVRYYVDQHGMEKLVYDKVFEGQDYVPSYDDLFATNWKIKP